VKHNDLRSHLVALVPDRLVNPGPGQATTAASTDGSHAIVDLLTDLGFGLVQLPPALLRAEQAAIALDYALDQLEDYAANGYRTIWLADGPTPADRDLSARIRIACRRRAFTGLEEIDLGTASSPDASRIEPVLRAIAQSVVPRAALLSDAS
jgi:hypothetical protein